MKYFAASPVVPPANPLLPEWPELVIGAVAFLIVFAILGRVLLPRIQRTLEERADAIEGGLERAKETQAEADHLLAEYREQLAQAREEAARLRGQAQEQGAQIIAEMREQAQVEARRLVDAAHAQIESDRQRAVAALRTEVGALAVELASRVVAESLEDEARQRRIVDRFLEDLERESAGEAGGTEHARS